MYIYANTIGQIGNRQFSKQERIVELGVKVRQYLKILGFFRLKSQKEFKIDPDFPFVSKLFWYKSSGQL